jgi:acetylornithine deacetylase/succinyl-diaminopimelate desuccinylase-like protein
VLSTAPVHRALAPAHARLAARDADTVRAQVAVSEIPAPTGDEGERASWVASRFRALGLDAVRVDGAGNVIGRRPGATGAAPVAVLAHLDTVFPREVPLGVRREGARLVGPGIGDNGRGLAVMLALAEEIDGRRLRTQRAIEFVATVGEEGLGNLRGARAYFDGSAPPTAAVVLDGAGDERVVHRALGSRRFRVTFRGPGGHSWGAFGVAHPVHAAVTCGSALAALPLPNEPRATLSVGRVGGGVGVNAIPTDGWLEVDVRSTSAAALASLEAELRRIAHGAAYAENARRAPGSAPLSFHVEVIGDRPCGELSAEHPLVRTAVAATRLVGRAPELVAASTDANVPIALGVPAIAIGAGGRGGDAHTPQEWFDNTDGALGIGRALTVVAAAAELL